MKNAKKLLGIIPIVAIMGIGLIACGDGGGPDPDPIYEIGETGPGGGIVFYDKGSKSDGWRYLEAAPSNQATQISWCNCSGSDCNVNTGTAIGTGKANTAAIIAHTSHSNVTASNCAAKAANIEIGGKNDWFLPSRDELYEMYRARSHLGNFLGDFWSSSQYQDNNKWACFQNSDNVFQYSSSKFNLNRVRAIRAF